MTASRREHGQKGFSAPFSPGACREALRRGAQGAPREVREGAVGEAYRRAAVLLELYPPRRALLELERERENAARETYSARKRGLSRASCAQRSGYAEGLWQAAVLVRRIGEAEREKKAG